MDSRSAELLADFARYLKDERRSSPHTVRAYGADIAAFAGYASEQGVSLAEVSHATVRGFLSVLAADRHPSTRARKLASVRAFYRFLVRTRTLEASPAKLVKSPKRPRSLPKVLPVDEVFALLRAPSGDGIGAVRDRAMLEVLYASGLRVSE